MKAYFIHHLEYLVGIVIGIYGTIAAVCFLLALRSRTPAWKFLFRLITLICITIAWFAMQLPV